MESWIGEYAIDRNRLRVYGPEGISRLSNLLVAAYRPEVETYLVTEIRRKTRYLVEPEALDVDPGWSCRIGSSKVSAGLADHGVIRVKVLAYRIDSSGKSIVFSGDTVPCEGVINLAQGADVLVHECSFLEEEVEDKKRLGFATYIQVHRQMLERWRVALTSRRWS